MTKLLPPGIFPPMSGDLTEDDFAALAAASFRALDGEETLGVSERGEIWQVDFGV
jgi:hypothetical protein